MKKLSVLLLITSFLLSIIFLCPSINADPAVIISDYEINPSVFLPGDSGLLTLTLYNAETSATYTSATVQGSTTNTYVEMNGAVIKNIWILSARDGDKKIRADLNYEDVGVLAPGSSYDIQFEIFSENGISEGLYFPVVRVDLESSAHDDVSYPISIRVSNETVDLIQTDVPSQISLSGSTEITFTVVNNIESTVESVHIVPEEIQGIEITPNSYFVGSMDAYSSEDITFSVIPRDKGIKNLTFDVNFNNGYNAHNNSITFPIEIVDSYDVEPVLFSYPSTISKGDSNRFRIEVYNAKTESISGVKVIPIYNEDIIITPTQYFIGSMDADDVFSASFNVDTDNLKVGENYSIAFKVLFKQNDNYYESPIVSSKFQVIDKTENQGSNLYLYIAVVIIIILIIIFYLFVYKKRRTS